MKALNNRAVALVLAILVVALSTASNVRRNLSREAKKAEAYWTETNGIADQLDTAFSNASQLWSITKNAPALEQENAALRSSYNALYDAMQKDDRAEIGVRLSELNASVNALLPSLNGSGLDADSLAWAERYASMVTNAARVISSSGYNAAVEQYYALAEGFPVTLVRSLLSLDEPAYLTVQ